MDRSLDVRTPESIAFSYELAGLGSRFLAVTIDTVIQIAVLTLLFVGFAYMGAHIASFHDQHVGGKTMSERAATNLGIAIVIFIVFAILFGYFMVFEAFGNGQTPGKKALGIRVVRDGGYPVDFSAALIRNVIRIGELSLGFYAISAACALLSRENKRVGDLAAGTVVVRDGKRSDAAMLQAVLNEPVYAATGFVTGEERALIHRFIERRDKLDPQRRQAFASQLANRVRDRVPQDLQRLSDEALLERL
jgi:uncharacterized RDD family membrane protein YckC